MSINLLPAPLLTAEEALARRQRLEELVLKYLEEGIDYDTPKRGGDDGDENKATKKARKSLLKPGAEKLCDIFGFASQSRTVQRVVEAAQPVPFIFYEVEVDIIDQTGRVLATRSGVCSTAELKYRYNWVNQWRVAELGLNKADLPSKTITPKGKPPFTMYRIDNPSINDLANTIVAMATKRAFISATKAATATTGIFDEMDEEAPEEAQTGLPTMKQILTTPSGEETQPAQGASPPKPEKPNLPPPGAPPQSPPPATDNPQDDQKPAEGDPNKCATCGAEVTKSVKEFSSRKFGKTLCRDHQPKGGGQ